MLPGIGGQPFWANKLVSLKFRILRLVRLVRLVKVSLVIGGKYQQPPRIVWNRRPAPFCISYGQNGSKKFPCRVFKKQTNSQNMKILTALSMAHTAELNCDLPVCIQSKWIRKTSGVWTLQKKSGSTQCEPMNASLRDQRTAERIAGHSVCQLFLWPLNFLWVASLNFFRKYFHWFDLDIDSGFLDLCYPKKIWTRFIVSCFL